METIKNSLHPIHREGYVFIAIFAVAAILLGLLWEPLGWIGLILTLWCVYFFRDPERQVPQNENLIVSPADGLVSFIGEAPLPAELSTSETSGVSYNRISIFLNVFNVHVNRSPVAGKIEKVEYHHGKFLHAADDKASDDNERNSLLIGTASGMKVGVVQIAGYIARRIVCYAKTEDVIAAGERYGIIRFGSRVDVYLPTTVTPKVVVGQIAVGGETIIADLESSTPIIAKKI